MNDISHWFSGDSSLTDSGDLALSTSVTLTQQRIMRRVLTNPGTNTSVPDYIWNPDYGCGAANYVGAPANRLNELRATILSQLAQEPGISSSTDPEIDFSFTRETLKIIIKYVDAYTGTVQVLSIDAGGAQ